MTETHYFPAEHDVFFDYAESGWKAVDAAFSKAGAESAALEVALAEALQVGVGPFISALSNAEVHAVAGFLAGAANRLSRLATTHTNHTTNAGELK